jgi:hypothetical protein
MNSRVGTANGTGPTFVNPIPSPNLTYTPTNATAGSIATINGQQYTLVGLLTIDPVTGQCYRVTLPAFTSASGQFDVDLNWSEGTRGTEPATFQISGHDAIAMVNLGGSALYEYSASSTTASIAVSAGASIECMISPNSSMTINFNSGATVQPVTLNGADDLASASNITSLKAALATAQANYLAGINALVSNIKIETVP